jgi:KaiC/GvpD/RAD55 family RecA-like ATPase
MALAYRWAGDVEVPRETDYVVKGLIDRGRLVTVVGAPGAGKTFWTFGVACAVAAGRQFNGHRVNQGAVLWLGREGHAGTAIRAAAHRHAGLLRPADPLAIVNVPISLLANADEVATTVLVAAQERGHEAKLVVFDTLSRALAGHNENDGEIMTAAVRAADRIAAESSAAVILIHHFGKNAENGARGHSSLLGAVDVQIDLLRTGDDRRAVVKKNRDGEEGREYPFRLHVVDLGQDEEGDAITSCVAVPADAPPVRALDARGANQRNALVAIRAWTATQNSTDPLLSSDDLRKLLTEAGVRARQSRFEVINWLVNAGALTASIGGHKVNRDALR